ncbi:MAG: PhoH family protein, partial [Phycisphaerae bacterium]|nr:PhoH family protein [Phycisphaerae bacterium]
MEKVIELGDAEEQMALFGSHDRHLRLIRDALAVKISARDGKLHIDGASAAVERAAEVIRELQHLTSGSEEVSAEHVGRIIEMVKRQGLPRHRVALEVFTPGRPVRAMTNGQVKYVHAMERSDLVFCIGPAGTGKTYLAVAMALQALKQKTIKRVVLARPAVEAGERLGFLPGDMMAKVNPYLRPLLDALHDMMDFEQAKMFLENDIIEIIPLAYMRGRTLNDAIIILDEAQNTTVAQMKMFLTRMGMRSRMVITGDITQVDLHESKKSGLIDARDKLSKIKSIEIVTLTRRDIVRHRLVQE